MWRRRQNSEFAPSHVWPEPEGPQPPLIGLTLTCPISGSVGDGGSRGTGDGGGCGPAFLSPERNLSQSMGIPLLCPGIDLAPTLKDMQGGREGPGVGGIPLGPPSLLGLQRVFSWEVDLALYENSIRCHRFADRRAMFQY